MSEFGGPYEDVSEGYYVREDPDYGEVLVPIDPDEPRRCVACGAVCDFRVQVCECGPDCPLPPVSR